MIGRAYRTAQILSIDIVIGVVILLRFFCVQFGVAPGWEVYTLLGGVVWLIYTADHLRDAESKIKSSRERYLFHKNHRKSLLVVAVLVLIALSILVLFIPLVIFLGGLALAVFSFAYLMMQHRLSRFLSKELYVALVYSAGILMVPFLLSQTYRWDVFLLLVLLTFVNLSLFSWYEKEDDIKDKFQSIATELKGKKLEKIILLLISIGLSIAVLSINLITIYFITGFVIYALMIISSDWFRLNHRYRAIGDGVFLLPILFEWL
ncbi:UbiA family prenyltransferase [Ekhidna sp. MALMAid0563]|uniref:UbiA family prenyltransferase n=1 Tax=Ekhidna sp. MALMAid0563 TaxID=3143937 RepID=UPI0032DEEE7A